MTNEADRWKVLWLLSFARLSMGFQFQSIGAIGPLLSVEYGLSLGALGWLIGVHQFPGVLLALPGALLGIRLGERRAVMLGLVLMATGGLVTALARNPDLLTLGRVVGGAGGVLFNVVATKLIADWFAGREITLAMSIYISTWPIGMALALLTLGAVATGWSTSAALAATGLLPLAGLAAVSLHPLVRGQPGALPDLGIWRLNAREWLVAVLMAGAAWTLYNVAFAVLPAFLPTVLAARGAGAIEAGIVTLALVFGAIVSIQASGWLGQKLGRPDLLAFIGLALWAGALVGLLWGGYPAAWLVVAGVVSGFATGVLVSLPAQLLRPQVRSAGMGAFYTVFYLGMALLPREVGRFAQVKQSPDAVIVAVIAIIGCVALLLAMIRLIPKAAPRPAA